MSSVSRDTAALAPARAARAPATDARTLAADARQSATIARATGRELVWGLRGVSREVARWRALAERIPGAELRTDALTAINRKRGNIDGAALFWTLPDRRNRELLRTLVAYEVLADYLDCVSERGASLGMANGRQLHLALIEALDPSAEMSDYYRYHHSDDDGGYLRALVDSCRAGCTRLPSYEQVAPLLARAASLALVLGVNHEPDPLRRDAALQEWVVRELPCKDNRAWFERTAGASAWLTVLAMLALAAEPRRLEPGWADRDAAHTYGVYLQWIAPAGAMLDSYGDILEDQVSGDHSYISHYPSMDVAVERMSELLRRARQEARALPNGSRHAVITACMIAFYLSKDSVNTPAMRSSTGELRRAGGPLVEMLLPILRLWRVAYGQRSA